MLEKNWPDSRTVGITLSRCIESSSLTSFSTCRIDFPPVDLLKEIGGYKPLDITSWVRTPCQWQGRTKPPGHNPLGLNLPAELEHNVRCRFMLHERGFWKLNFRIGGRKPQDITPWLRTPLSAFKSAMCDSVGFIRPCHWTEDSDLGVNRGYVRGLLTVTA